MSSERSWVEIDLGAFQSNLIELKKHFQANQEFLQIVKADAYGHGAGEIAKAAIRQGAVYLGVANAEEGKLLRLQGIRIPILILSPSLISEIPVILENDLSVSITELCFARALDLEAGLQKHKTNIHIKIDSGMHRNGFDPEEFLMVSQELKKLSNLHWEGIFSHYASSESDAMFSDSQTRCFQQVLDTLEVLPRYIHIANSSAIIHHNPPWANLVRLGILSYGVYTSVNQLESMQLSPVMRFKSTISHIKDIRKGQGLGYNQAWTSAQDTRYAIIPVGYADGYDFLLYNKAKVAIGGVLCPVIGRISMDMLCIDLSNC
ncbi:MAG: alanine racemase, partial [Candidatus Cloacimonadaceae bacterium]|nr:alanine racemase [Candidatus Cloacimonadaceae bacterium]